MIILIFLISFLGIYLTAYVFYELALFFVRYLVKDEERIVQGSLNQFVILIPAHNEELFLPRLLDSISGQNFPRSKFKTVVVADNCNDNTAQIARNYDTIVLERCDIEKVGKGYALKYGLENADLNEFHAIVIIDADCVLDRNALRNFDRHLKSGKRVLQSYSKLVNPDETWFTRVISVSQALSNEIILAAKEKLGFSIPLMGTGMCFSREILSIYEWDAFTVGEDWEFYAKLVREGEIIGFAKDAHVYHQESSTLKQATSQRMRWSGGRFAVAWKHGLKILYRGLMERNIVKIEASFPLLLPNPSLGLNMTVIGLALSLLVLKTENSIPFFIWFLALAAIQVIFFLLGVFYTRNKLKNFVSLFLAPIFLVWKMVIDILSAAGMGRKKWVRTERKL